jgi:hypothetical protein
MSPHAVTAAAAAAAAADFPACRQLTEMLPPLACVQAHDLPGIACIHLQSSAHLKATMRLLVPEAFEGSDTVDATSLAGFADRLSPSAEPMVLRLIDLQIFHMCRAQDATAHMRMHARLRPDLESTTGPAAAAIAAAKDAAVAATCMRSAARAGPVQTGWQQQQRQAKQQQQPEQQQQLLLLL